jgi:2,3-bisphosphoglycerate-dependent phosphoglycerate mutase
MSRIYLIRHCQAVGQEPSAPLTEAGRVQAETLAERWTDMSVTRIVSSPYERARQSVIPLATQLGLPVEEDERLVERRLATDTLADWRNHLRRSFDDPDYCLPGGESGRGAASRGLDCLSEVRANQNVSSIVVTHGNLLTLILNHFDPAFGFDAWQGLTNPDVYLLEGDGATTRIRTLVKS